MIAHIGSLGPYKDLGKLLIVPNILELNYGVDLNNYRVLVAIFFYKQSTLIILCFLSKSWSRYHLSNSREVPALRSPSCKEMSSCQLWRQTHASMAVTRICCSMKPSPSTPFHLRKNSGLLGMSDWRLPGVALDNINKRLIGVNGTKSSTYFYLINWLLRK